MSDNKTKIECRLITRGYENVDSSVSDDLTVPDPEPTIGKEIIKKVIKEDTKDDGRSEDS